MAKRIICTVTNDLVFDQRMNRICTALATAGYDVTLIGRTHSKSPTLTEKPFKQKRFRCWISKGKLFYAEYNIKLFFYLLFLKADVLCAIDLDTILPVLFASKLKRCQRIYDAHELFCEMQEITSRPHIYKIWKAIEKYSVPKFDLGYTIGDLYAQEFKQMYERDYEVIRNATVLRQAANTPTKELTYILYQGAVNKGRCFEHLIPAMKHCNAQLIICGAGNFVNQTKALIKQHAVEDKVQMKGYIRPHELVEYTNNAYIGITLFSNETHSKSNYLSMANRFFDYMHAGVPQIAVAFPEYIAVNRQFEIATLLSEVNEFTISAAINELITNKSKHQAMQAAALNCAKVYNWQNEEKKLIAYYKKHIG